MHPRTSPPGSPRLTSYAPATGLPPPASQGQAATPALAAAPGTARAPKRAREEDDKASSSSSSSSGEAGPLARRAQPLTTAVTSAARATPVDPDAFDAFSHYVSPWSALGARSSAAFARLPRPQPLVQRRPMPPDEVLATIAAFAATKKPLAYFQGLRRSLGHRTDPKPTAQAHMLSLRPETLLQWPASFQTAAAWRAYVQAGGTLAAVPVAERSLACCEAAIEHTPRALRDVPAALLGPALCAEAVRRDGYALESVPVALLDLSSAHREMLCDLAYASPRPPRIRHVPHDLLTEDRCIDSLQWAPLDLGDIPQELRTWRVCLAAIRFTPEHVEPPTESIPAHVWDDRLAIALASIAQDQNTMGIDWASLPETVFTPHFIRRCLSWHPDELPRNRVLRGPVPLDLLAEVLREKPNLFKSQFNIEGIAQGLMESARAAGFQAGDALPRDRWPPGVLPPDLSELEVMRWAVRRSNAPDFFSVPEHLRQDREIARQILSTGDAHLWGQTRVDILLDHLDLLVRRIEGNPTELKFVPEPVLWALPPQLIARACRALVQPGGFDDGLPPVGPVIDRIHRLFPQALDEETLKRKGLLEAAREPSPAPGQRPGGRGKRLNAWPPEMRTRALCESLVERAGEDYRYVPKEHRNPGMLMLALKTAPTLLLDLPSDEVTEPFCLTAMETLGLSPAHLPLHILDSHSFRERLRLLPKGPFNALAFKETFNPEDDQDIPHPLTVAWVEERLGEDPSRAELLERFAKPEWALTAHRMEVDWETIVLRTPDPAVKRELLAELGPWDIPSSPAPSGCRLEAVAEVESVRYGSSSSSSSSSAAAAARPS